MHLPRPPKLSRQSSWLVGESIRPGLVRRWNCRSAAVWNVSVIRCPTWKLIPESKTSGRKCPMIKSIQASAAEHNCFSLLWTLVCCAEFNSIDKSTDKFVGVCVSFFGPFCHNTPSWVRYPPHHLVISCSTYGKVVHVLHLPKLSNLALTHSHATKVHAGASYQSER